MYLYSFKHTFFFLITPMIIRNIIGFFYTHICNIDFFIEVSFKAIPSFNLKDLIPIIIEKKVVLYHVFSYFTLFQRVKTRPKKN